MRRTSASFLARAAASASDSPPASDASARRNPRSVAAEGAGAGRRRRRRGGSRSDGVFAQTNLRRRRARRAKHGGEGHQRGFPRAVTRASTAPFASGTRSSTGLTGVRGGSGTPASSPSIYRTRARRLRVRGRTAPPGAPATPPPAPPRGRARRRAHPRRPPRAPRGRTGAGARARGRPAAQRARARARRRRTASLPFFDRRAPPLRGRRRRTRRRTSRRAASEPPNQPLERSRACLDREPAFERRASPSARRPCVARARRLLRLEQPNPCSLRVLCFHLTNTASAMRSRRRYSEPPINLPPWPDARARFKSPAELVRRALCGSREPAPALSGVNLSRNWSTSEKRRLQVNSSGNAAASKRRAPAARRSSYFSTRARESGARRPSCAGRLSHRAAPGPVVPTRWTSSRSTAATAATATVATATR